MSQTDVRAKIEILPDALINKIAAGEVVERPASVVKELLENAIDAGAHRITLAIEDGGRTLIRVVDNGCGIPAEQAPLAFAQHATSKIKTTDDLFAIRTMGFRGEALASIASVSHATMITRTADAEQACRIEVKDSLVGPVVPCAAPVGTAIEIRDLFYSVPARRKFLRSDATEFGHIHEMVLRTALPNPQVAFALSHNGRNVLDLPIASDPKARVSAALGPELHDQLLAVDFRERGITVRGFAGQPALARATAKFQYVFLNGRFIRDRSLLHALKEAYRGLIEPISQPLAVLMIEMDPTAFDVNVHPQKTEVRFRDPNGPYSVVLAAVRERLLESDLTPALRTRPGSSCAEETPADAAAGSAAPAAGVTMPSQPESTRQIIADFFKQTTPSQPRLAFGVETGRVEAPGSPAIPASPGLPPLDDLAAARNVMAASSVAPGSDVCLPSSPAAPATPRLVQLHNAYIVVETPDGLEIIDQHALHERIIYEELFNRATRGPLEGQRLLIPEVLPVNPRQQAVLEAVRPLLGDLGIEVAAFDAQSVAVHTFPSLLSKVPPREFLRDLLDKLLELGSRLSREDLLHEVLDMASCKAAVKAGYPLSGEEIAALLARREQVERSSNCPHGRPTTLRLSLGELERQFKRK